jgi:hypothetical protein
MMFGAGRKARLRFFDTIFLRDDHPMHQPPTLAGPLHHLGIERERAKAFAAEFDPQPFHLDVEAARHSIVGGSG